MFVLFSFSFWRFYSIFNVYSDLFCLPTLRELSSCVNLALFDIRLCLVNLTLVDCFRLS